MNSLDVSCEYGLDTYPTSYYDEYEATPYAAQFVGDVQSIAYCEFYYQCGDEVTSRDVPYTTESYTVQVGEDQTLVYCIPYCAGFRESTEQTHVLCNTINGVNSGSDRSSMDQDNQTIALSKSTSHSSSEASPNPFSSTINLRNIPVSQAAYTVQIVDVTGGVIVESMVAGDARQYDLVTGHIIPGLYFLHIIDAEGKLVLQQKMIKVQ